MAEYPRKYASTRPISLASAAMNLHCYPTPIRTVVESSWIGVKTELAKKMKTTASLPTFSMGVVTFASPPVSVDELLRQSDALMYRVKMHGKMT